MTQPVAPTTGMQVLDIPMARIYCDSNFNCRGVIRPFDVADLAQSIRDRGLQFAISVQPAADVDGGLPVNPEDGQPYEYRIVAGHRRYTAVKILKWPTIPATVRKDLDEKGARILNLVENFQRQDLNILQEAEALKHLHEAGVPRETVAREIGMSGGWVQVRFNLLRLPVEIQQEAAAGMINQFHIKALCSLKSSEAQFEAVRKIKEAKLRGEKPPSVGERKKKTADIKKARQPNEMFDMIEILAKTTCGYGLHTRVLAWAAGEITSAEFFLDIRKADPTFFPPPEF